MVAAAVAILFDFVLFTVACYIHLASEDRFEGLQSLLFPSFVDVVAVVEELFDAKHVAMISDSHATHAVGNSFVNEL